MSTATSPLRDALGQARERFLALQPRERWVLGVGAAALLLTVLYLSIWEPLLQARTQRAAALESSRAIAIRLEQAALQLRANAGTDPASMSGRNLSLLAAVDQASKQGTLRKAPSRMQPEGDREVRVWIEDASFDALVRWIDELHRRYGVTVQTLDVEPQAMPGQVNARLSLVRV